MPTRITHYDIGDLWTPQASFTVAGVATDPSLLTVVQQAPDGTETTLASAVNPASLTSSSSPVAKTGTGVFKLNPGVAFTAAGRWYVKFTGTGTAAASETHEAIADPDVFTSESGIGTRALVTLQEAKDWLNQRNIDAGEDIELVRVINDISDLFHAEAEREFKVIGSNPQARIFHVDGEGIRNGIVNVGDLQSVTTLEVLNSDWSTVRETVDSADYALLPRTREAWQPARQIQLNHRNGVGWLRGEYLVRVTGAFGFPAVPGRVRQAVLDEIAVVLDRDVEHYRIDLGGLSTDAGGRGTTVVQVGSGRQRILAMSPKALAVAWSFRSPLVG